MTPPGEHTPLITRRFRTAHIVKIPFEPIAPSEVLLKHIPGVCFDSTSTHESLLVSSCEGDRQLGLFDQSNHIQIRALDGVKPIE